MNRNRPPTAAASGRPRDQALDASIIEVTLDCLTRMEFDRITIAEIARLSGSPKSTIYRRYPDVRSLVVAAIRHELDGHDLTFVDQGSLRADLESFLTLIALVLNDRRARMLASLLFAMRDDPALAAPLTYRLELLHLEGWKPIVERGVARGELRAEALDMDLLGKIAPSLIFHRIMVDQEPVTPDFLQAILDHSLAPALAVFEDRTPAAPPGGGHVRVT